MFTEECSGSWTNVLQLPDIYGTSLDALLAFSTCITANHLRVFVTRRWQPGFIQLWAEPVSACTLVKLFDVVVSQQPMTCQPHSRVPGPVVRIVGMGTL